MLGSKQEQMINLIGRGDPQIIRGCIDYLESQRNHTILMSSINRYSVKYSILLNIVRDKDWNRADSLIEELFEIVFQ